MKKLERVNNELFETLTIEETQMVAGGVDGSVSGTGSYSEASGADVSVTVTIKF